MNLKLTQQDVLFQPLLMAVKWLKENRPAAIATVIETWGSAPCPVGSHLLIDNHANFYGSVSGGCVETEVIGQALDVITDGKSRVLEFGIADETAWRVGLSCGGRIKILVTPLTAVFTDISQALENRRASYLLTNIQNGAQQHIFDGDVSLLPLMENVNIGKSGILSLEGQDYFLNIYAPHPRLVLVGAVHISQNLLVAAKLTNFDVTIIDPRSAFATEQRFGDADLHVEWPQDYFGKHALDKHTAVAALTHDPKIDDPALIAALQAKAFYIGALGSRKTHVKRLERLYQAGFSENDCGLIHAPIGLDIKAQGPAEIAIAVLAQVIAAYRNRSTE
ncbi:XdhC family protein [Paenochrobactrum pullorum]|uniref:XdhC family protein n=1 Tax=Paenochrobactrum pullorum TaxID=1324351 RepID=UPI0035BBCBB0